MKSQSDLAAENVETLKTQLTKRNQVDKDVYDDFDLDEEEAKKSLWSNIDTKSFKGARKNLVRPAKSKPQ